MDVRSDPRIHDRFLQYRERHAYFGRDDLRTPLTMDEFGALYAEREALMRTRATHGEEGANRLAELEHILLLD